MYSPESVFRIIDVNLDRAAEGLRVLEDIARLLLNDAVLTEQLKAMRHDILSGDLSLQKRLLQGRDAPGDVGADTGLGGETKERDLRAIVVANARRVQESLRVLEEMAKLPDIAGLDPGKYKKARFGIYSIERDLFGRLLRRDKVKRLAGLYAIIDAQLLKGRDCLAAARQVIEGGAKVVQLRDKLSSKKDLLPAARQLMDLCARHDVLFIVNDHLDIVLASGADGLHVGQNDLPVATARRLLPVDTLVGCSTRTVEQALAAQAAGADYVAVGSIYPTATKEDIKVVGLATLREVRRAVSVPVVAIGGINRDNVGDVIGAGADAVAIVSAILQAEDIAAATRRITACLGEKR